MSSSLALASVTALLKDLLENGLASNGVTARLGGDASVSAMPPDRISSGADEKAQLNVFLYHVTPRSALRQTQAGTPRPLALELHYLLTAYGAQDYQTEILLGLAFKLMHENPTFEKERIRSTLKALSHSRDRRVIPAPQAALSGSTLADDVESITIEAEFLSSEEVSRLWSALQAKFRPSATYKVSVVVIDSSKPNGA